MKNSYHIAVHIAYRTRISHQHCRKDTARTIKGAVKMLGESDGEISPGEKAVLEEYENALADEFSILKTKASTEKAILKWNTAFNWGFRCCHMNQTDENGNLVNKSDENAPTLKSLFTMPTDGSDIAYANFCKLAWVMMKMRKIKNELYARGSVQQMIWAVYSRF